ncbi:hypothetical protein [Pedobacter jejuensis]|uniref:Uncharacterized protein n=1 Tax=Pedobacter jejuensis TaxID=1268550 RepID=A0A3N0BN35_9SPHI|nr:hypothetical protein [Pedobacter jejuensis]RNL50164.1 hypothetical protein D7004_18295 [Pedobacter jejuensis]
MKSTVKIPYWILLIIFTLIICLTVTNPYVNKIFNKKEETHVKAKVKLKTFYATDKEVRKVYNDLMNAGYTEGNFGTFTQFNERLQNWMEAYITWQMLVKKGYRDYGTENEFVRKYSKDAPERFMK